MDTTDVIRGVATAASGPVGMAMALAQFAPSLVKFFTGSDKAEEVANQVLGIAQVVTGAPTPAAAVAAIQMDPVKAAEFQQAALAADADLEKGYLADRKDARAMQVAALAQDDLFSKRFVYYFAAAWSLFAMVYFVAVTFIPLSAGGQRVADTILGVLITSVVGVMFAYFYGSTKGSAEKTRLLAASAPAMK
jgi:preprotein translocase subunit SecY